MKKNININMFGQLFNIDEDAYQLLSRYLESMKKYFRSREGGEEIAEDIERHVAELMWQHSQNGTQPISIEAINEIVSQIGNPSEIDTPEGEESQEGMSSADQLKQNARKAWSNFESSVNNNIGKRHLYRNPNDKMISGVCSGLALFFGWGSPTALRLSLVILMVIGFGLEWGYFLLSVLVLYIIMSLVIPLPKTAEDRLKMRGEAITPEALNQEILRESNDAVTCHNRTPQNNNGCLLAILKVILFILLLPIIIGIGFALFVLICVAFGLFGAFGTLFPLALGEEILFFDTMFSTHGVTCAVALFALLAVIVLPIIALVRAMRHSTNPERKTHGWWILIFWVIALALLITSSISLITKMEYVKDNLRNTPWNVSINNHNLPALTINPDSMEVEIEKIADKLDSVAEKINNTLEEADSLSYTISVKKKTKTTTQDKE